MAITYPITLPISGLISSITFRPLSAVAAHASTFTFSEEVQVHQGQAWRADIVLEEILSGGDAEGIIAALLSLNGRQGTFLLGDPTLTAPRGTPTGTPVVNGAGQSGQELNTKGWGALSTNVLLAGDWIQLGSGLTQRIYRVLKNVSSDAGGLATIDIWPRLRESPADNAALTLNNTAGLFRLFENEMPWEISAPSDFEFAFTAVEANIP